MAVIAKKLTSKISKGEQQGRPIYTSGAEVAFIGIPPEMNGTRISLIGSFDGSNFFPVLGSKGPMSFSTKNPNAPIDSPLVRDQSVVLPVVESELIEGIRMLAPISSSVEVTDRLIDFYLIDD